MPPMALRSDNKPQAVPVPLFIWRNSKKAGQKQKKNGADQTEIQADLSLEAERKKGIGG